MNTDLQDGQSSFPIIYACKDTFNPSSLFDEFDFFDLVDLHIQEESAFGISAAVNYNASVTSSQLSNLTLDAPASFSTKEFVRTKGPTP